MSKLPESAKRSIRTVLTDLDLSMMVSVPTSRRPMDLGSMLYFSSREETPARREASENALRWDICASLGNRLTRQGERVDVLAVVGAGHVRLAKTDGVFTLWDAIEDFEGFLGDTLQAQRMPRQQVT